MTTEFVACVKWIKRGVSKTVPEKVSLDASELNELLNLPDNGERSEDQNLAEGSAEAQPMDEYNFADYDNDDMSGPLQINNVAVLNGENSEVIGDDLDSEEEDDIIKESDNLIVVGNSLKDCDSLNIYVYNEENNDLYVHHEIVISSCPLSLEWIDYTSQNEQGNLIVVGEMSPVIEIWDLDIINPLQPLCKLGYHSNKRKYAHRNIGHKDAVLTLSWNTTYPHILASGSADQKVILWDLDIKKPSTTLSNFTNKVETIAWHPKEGHTLLTGSSDNSAKIFDCRSDALFKNWSFEEEALEAKWNAWDDSCAVVGTSGGKIYSIDIRTEQPLWSTESIGSDITGISMPADCPGMLVATYQDGTIRVWDINETIPKHIATKAGSVGSIHCLALNPDVPHMGCVGGIKKNKTFSLINLKTINEVTQHWNTWQ